MSFDFRHVTGPFDIIGDVHGCFDELVELLERLGYRFGDGQRVEATPEGRHLIFVGDLVDRGPKSVAVLGLVMAMVSSGQASCVIGNHDLKFKRWLEGNKVTLTHGLETTVHQLAREPDLSRPPIAAFIDGLPPYLWLDGGRLVVAHAGIEAQMIGQLDGRIRHFCIYGDTDGRSDAQGLVIRYNWAMAYDGEATVVYGHIPVAEPTWVNNTVCIDTGCCFGGALTALRWPERTFVSVPARAEHWRSVRPFGLPGPRP